MNFKDLTILSASQGLADKEFSSEELAEASWQRISQTEDKIKAFLTITKESALAAAAELKPAATRSVLSGLPAAIKDVIMTQGVRTTAASKILDNYVGVYDATVVLKLKKEGLVLMGKTNCDEFAMGGSTENSAYYPTRNPWDLLRVPGGSSGGSAAAVAAGQVLYALGTDTGGSIRQPASFCGVVGLKPSYGLVSRYGLIAMASSLDCIGSFTKTVADAALLLQFLAGQDSRDATTAIKSPPNYFQELKKGAKGMKLGVPKEYFVAGLDPKIKDIIKQQIDLLSRNGLEIREVSLPHTEYALAVYYIIMPAEVSSNLAKFDGLRFGRRTEKKSEDLFSYYLQTRREGLGAESRRRILVGTYVLSAGYVDQYYLQAQKVRTKLREDFDRVFKEVDLLLTPTTPTTAFGLGEKIDDPISMYLSDIYTVSVNLAGLPALSVPAGLADGLPVGLQIIGPRFGEDKILRLGHFFEQLRGKFPSPEL